MKPCTALAALGVLLVSVAACATGEPGSSQFYYSLTLTLTGTTLIVTFKIPNPEGDVTCTLTKR